MAKSAQAAFWILCILGSLVALALAWIPVPVSISHFIIEDLFYYLQAARHLNAGDVASLDGVHSTNGFHPLWMWVTCGVERIAQGDGGLSVHIELTLCALCFVLTGAVLFLCLRKSMGSPLALPLTALFLFNYRMMTIPLGGLESGLAGLSVGLLTLFLVTHPPGWRAAIPTGLLLGLACLSRLDALLLAGIVLAWWCVSPLIGPDSRSSSEEGPANTDKSSTPQSPALISMLLSSALAGMVCLVTLIPWFVFSWKTSRTLLPNSRVAIESWSGYQWDSAEGLAGNLMKLTKSRIGGSIEPLNDLGNILGVWPLASPEAGVLRYLGVLVTALALLLLLVIAWRGHRLAGIPRLAWIPVYVIAHVGYYVAFGHIGIRYFYPAFLPALVWVGSCAGALTRRSLGTSQGRCWVTPVVALLLLGATLGGIDSFRKGQATGRFHPLHLGLYRDLAPWLAANSPTEARVGSFNAGILSYYSGRKVVNLDGVMNDSVIPAIQSKGLAGYTDQEGIDYLADAEGEITKFMGRFGGDPSWESKWETVLSVPTYYRGGTASRNMVVMKRN